MSMQITAAAAAALSDIDTYSLDWQLVLDEAVSRGDLDPDAAAEITDDNVVILFERAQIESVAVEDSGAVVIYTDQHNHAIAADQVIEISR